MTIWVGLLALDSWVSSARLAEALRASGLRIGAFCEAGSPLAATRHVDRLNAIDETGLRAALEQFCAEHRPVAVVPCDERAVRALHELFADNSTSTELRQTIRRSLGDPQGYAVATSKWSTHALATRLGLRVPAQRQIASIDEALAFASACGYPVILKREGTYGGAGCRVCRSEGDILSGYRGLLASGRLQKLKGRAQAWMGWLRDSSERSSEPLIIQRFHEGQTAFSAAVARDGVMLKGLATTAERVHPQPTGASTVVRLRETPDLVEITAALVRELGYSGFIGVDFIIDHASGLAYLLEINPRVTPLAPLGRRLGGDLCAAFAASFAGTTVPPTPRQTTIAALFPNEWLRDPESPYLTTTYHDVPHHDPELMAWIYSHLPATRRFMLRWGILPCAGLDRAARRGGGLASATEHPLEPVEITGVAKQDFGHEPG
ncbi:MAG TPA: ATP-grasp domain-containing protein [Aliidongia sp.]|nr:ATP-grasp domain-containing protein [Aliidongia sp.]